MIFSSDSSDIFPRAKYEQGPKAQRCVFMLMEWLHDGVIACMQFGSLYSLVFSISVCLYPTMKYFMNANSEYRNYMKFTVGLVCKLYKMVIAFKSPSADLNRRMLNVFVPSGLHPPGCLCVCLCLNH